MKEELLFKCRKENNENVLGLIFVIMPNYTVQHRVFDLDGNRIDYNSDFRYNSISSGSFMGCLDFNIDIGYEIETVISTNKDTSIIRAKVDSFNNGGWVILTKI